jgi:hypothetical protein
MLKFEINQEVADVTVGGNMEDVICEAMVAIRAIYDFLKDHSEEHGEAFKVLLQMHVKDGGAVFADEYKGKFQDETEGFDFDEDLPF